MHDVKQAILKKLSKSVGYHIRRGNWNELSVSEFVGMCTQTTEFNKEEQAEDRQAFVAAKDEACERQIKINRCISSRIKDQTVLWLRRKRPLCQNMPTKIRSL